MEQRTPWFNDKNGKQVRRGDTIKIDGDPQTYTAVIRNGYIAASWGRSYFFWLTEKHSGKVEIIGRWR